MGPRAAWEPSRSGPERVSTRSVQSPEPEVSEQIACVQNFSSPALKGPHLISRSVEQETAGEQRVRVISLRPGSWFFSPALLLTRSPALFFCPEAKKIGRPAMDIS